MLLAEQSAARPEDLADVEVERRAEAVVLGLLNRGLESTRLGVTSAALLGYPMEAPDGRTAEARGQPGHSYSLTATTTSSATP